MTNSTQPATPRRLWPRFTLRALLLVMTLLCVALAVWTYRAREQRRIVARIQTLGGTVCYERDGPDAPEPRGALVEWLAQALGRDYFESVVEASVRDCEPVPDVMNLPRLTRLQIFCDELDDRDVAHLARCREVEVVNLGINSVGVNAENQVTKVTDRSLAVLGKLPRLRVLHLRGRNLSAAGIEALAASPTLEVLTVGSCAASVDATDFDAIKRQDRIKSFVAWRSTSSGPDEIIARW